LVLITIQIPSQRQHCCKQMMNIVQLRINRACVALAFGGLVKVTEEEMAQTKARMSCRCRRVMWSQS
jgi:hypothetical protein